MVSIGLLFHIKIKYYGISFSLKWLFNLFGFYFHSGNKLLQKTGNSDTSPTHRFCNYTWLYFQNRTWMEWSEVLCYTEFQLGRLIRRLIFMMSAWANLFLIGIRQKLSTLETEHLFQLSYVLCEHCHRMPARNTTDGEQHHSGGWWYLLSHLTEKTSHFSYKLLLFSAKNYQLFAVLKTIFL